MSMLRHWNDLERGHEAEAFVWTELPGCPIPDRSRPGDVLHFHSPTRSSSRALRARRSRCRRTPGCFFLAGQSVGLVKEIKPAVDVVRALVEGAKDILSQLAADANS
jgi:hypothetical protein